MGTGQLLNVMSAGDVIFVWFAGDGCLQVRRQKGE